MTLPDLTPYLVALTLAVIALFFMYYFYLSAPKFGTTEWLERIVTRPKFRFAFTVYPMQRRDIVPLSIVLIVMTAVSFFNLGDTSAPQTFHNFTEENPSYTIPLDGEKTVSRMMFYTGLISRYSTKSSYTLEYSSDGVTWREAVNSVPIVDPENPEIVTTEERPTMIQNHADLFKWRTAAIDNPITASYLRITASNFTIALGEIALYNEDDELIIPAGTSALFDEQQLIPERATYLNGMYFDEIYHGRAAYETLQGLYPYETVHPPLGKTIISLGVRIFGMTPFGWRFMGTLCGILMLAAIYIFLKNMFGKTFVATCGTLILGFDFMRYVQTRIATIDTYAVLFIILAYLFMYRYMARDGREKLSESVDPLFMSGLFFGLGAACKWTVIYAGAGLFVMYILKLIVDYKYCYADGEPGLYSRRLLKLLPLTALFFLVIPAIIYCVSYIPFGLANDMRASTMLINSDFYKMIWKIQRTTFSYHSGLVAEHAYSSWWYEWVINRRPMLYYLEYMSDNMRSSFAAFGNPILWWGGLVAMGTMVWRVIRHRDARALLIVIGYLSQLVPWIPISRIVFVYHYFPCTIFLTLAMAHTFDTMLERGNTAARRAVAAITGAQIATFALFYPVLSGLPVSRAFAASTLKWFNRWPF